MVSVGALRAVAVCERRCVVIRRSAAKEGATRVPPARAPFYILWTASVQTTGGPTSDLAPARARRAPTAGASCVASSLHAVAPFDRSRA
jgi:hypothetical protein